MINTVIFDLDGTLLDTLDDLTAGVNYALSAFGLCGIDRSRLRKYVGNGIPKQMERALWYVTTGEEPDMVNGNPRGELFDPCLALFTEYYNEHSADLTKPFPGITEMLEKVTNEYKTAIVTNKFDAAVQDLKKKFFAKTDIAIGIRDGIRPKPSADGVELVLKIFGTDKKDAVYVGDGETDIATARNSGLPIIAVGWGFRDRDYIAALKPDALVDSPEQLYGAIKAFG